MNMQQPMRLVGGGVRITGPRAELSKAWLKARHQHRPSAEPWQRLRDATHAEMRASLNRDRYFQYVIVAAVCAFEIALGVIAYVVLA